MDVKAIFLLGGNSEGEHKGRIADVPIAMLDLFGEPILQHTVSRLEKLGVTSTAIISDVPANTVPGLRNNLRPDVAWIDATEVWKACEQQFSDFAQQGAEVILVIQGGYLELDYEELVQYHLDRGARVTSVVDTKGQALGVYAISASRRNDAAHMFRTEMKQFRSPAEHYTFGGYANLLQTPESLRQLALDAFAHTNAIRPKGREIKPGVWVAASARIHPKARVLAPAYIGPRVNVRASAVVTRGSVIEHHAEVDCGTVVENSTILPFSYIGAGLDVTQSVVGFKHISNLRRHVTVEIFDSCLVSSSSASATASTLSNALDLMSYLPKTLIRGFSGKKVPATPATIPEAVKTTSPAVSVPEEVSSETGTAPFATKLMSVTSGELGSFGTTARNYGNK